jgi:TrmH family RNA methyltransferase
MITSAKNAKVKEIRALQARAKTRREAGAFVVEGVRLAEEALAHGWQPSLALYSEGLSERGLALVSQMREGGVPVEEAAPHVMQAASDTDSPQGLLLVLPLKPLPIPESLDFALVLDQLRDPGNLGTLLRSASAAGAGAVLLTEGSVDPFSPKVVRASMGAVFRLAVHTLSYAEVEELCKAHDLALWVADAKAETRHFEADLTGPTAIALGGEAHGHSAQIEALASGRLTIPMQGDTESLNAAMAGSVILFEAARQRIMKP